MSLENEFVPYIQAVELEELGFDERCIATIDQIEYVHIKGTKSLPRGSMMYDIIDCPLYQQAFRWFREKYDLHSYIDRVYEKGFYVYEYFIDKNNQEFGLKTYKEAELECLKKLIKIVKQKNQ